MSGILVIDTSSTTCTVILHTERAAVMRQRSGLRTHGEFLLSAVNEVMVEQGLELAELSALAVVAGPGSFTGIRIGIGVVQGLAAARQLPVLLLSSLEWLAYEASAVHDNCGVMVCQKAREDEFYVGQYAIHTPGRIDRICADMLTDIGSIESLTRNLAGEALAWIAIGDGWSSAGLDAVVRSAGFKLVDGVLQAGPESLCRLARQKLHDREQVPAELAQPHYLKDDLNYRTLF